MLYTTNGQDSSPVYHAPYSNALFKRSVFTWEISLGVRISPRVYSVSCRPLTFPKSTWNQIESRHGLKPRLLNNRNILKWQPEIHPHKCKPITKSAFIHCTEIIQNIPITTEKRLLFALGIPHPKPRRTIGSLIKSNLRIGRQSLLEFRAGCRGQDLPDFRVGVPVALE